MKPLLKKTDVLEYLVIFIVSCLLPLCGFLSPVLATETVTITLSSKAAIEEDTIRLGDIAQIATSDAELMKTLAGVDFGKAPLPGKSRYLDKRSISTQLEAKGIVLSSVTFLGPQATEVTRRSIEIPKEKIEQIVARFISETIIGNRPNLKLKEARVNTGCVLPTGSISYHCIPPETINSSGTIPIPVVFKVNGIIAKKLVTYASFESLIKIVVTTKPLRRSQVITEGDVQEQEMDVSGLPSAFFTSSEEVLGKRAKRALGAQVVLERDSIDVPPLVRRGDPVRIIAESGTLRITALAEVKEAGGQGESVKVLNRDSKKEVYARVVDSNTVMVDF